MLIIDGQKLYPVEIKKGKNPANPDKNFSVLDKLKMNFEVQPGLVACMAEDILPYKRDVWLLPVSAI